MGTLHMPDYKRCKQYWLQAINNGFANLFLLQTVYLGRGKYLDHKYHSQVNIAENSKLRTIFYSI